MAKQTTKKPTQKPSGATRLWPLLLLIGGILLIVLAYVALRDESQPPAGFQPQVIDAPAIAIQPESIDFGDVKLGDWVQAEFTVSNVGDEALHFSEDPYIELLEGC